MTSGSYFYHRGALSALPLSKAAHKSAKGDPFEKAALGRGSQSSGSGTAIPKGRSRKSSLETTP